MFNNRIVMLLLGVVLIGVVIFGVAVLPASAMPITKQITSPVQRPAADVLICHQTGSAANPWRPMKVTQALAQHHLSIGDVLADEQGRCPAESGHPTRSSVQVCHYTGSKAAPYETISISPSSIGIYIARGDTMGMCQ